MKQKMKEFVEEHKKTIAVVGVGAVVAASGLVGYKLGTRHGIKLFANGFGEEDFKIMIREWINSKSRYVHTLKPDEFIKFKELPTLAQKAIDFEESATHLDDTVTAMFVITNPKT